MNLFSPLSLGDIAVAMSFIVASIIFVVTMKPRIDNIEKAAKDNLKDRQDWQKEHETLARDRDKAIQDLALHVSSIAALQKNAEERMGRMDRLFEEFVKGISKTRSE